MGQRNFHTLINYSNQSNRNVLLYKNFNNELNMLSLKKRCFLSSYNTKNTILYNFIPSCNIYSYYLNTTLLFRNSSMNKCQLWKTSHFYNYSTLLNINLDFPNKSIIQPQNKKMILLDKNKKSEKIFKIN